MHHRAVGPEIAVSLDHTAGKVDFREFVSCHAYPRIGLGVLQQDVVLGFVLLDEIVLQEQCIRFGIHDRVLGIGDFGDKDARLDIEPFRRHEILRDPFVKVFGLAYIYDNPLGVIISVNSGGMWE